MKSVKGTETEKNLLAAFAGESQARNRYTFFAEKAEEEGYIQIANIFRETAYNGHFGRKGFPWEATNKVAALKKAVAKLAK